MRWRQIAYQCLRRLQGSARVSNPDATIDAEQGLLLARALERWADLQPVNLKRAREITQGRFTFLNHTEVLGDIDWQRRYVGHLWNYNLHYFEFAVDLALAWRVTGDSEFLRAFERLALSWIAGSRERVGDGWQSYPLSVRIVSWSKALLLFGKRLDESVRQQILASLCEQLEALSVRLEWHILANHLQRNLHALLIGSLLFKGASAARWRRLSLKHMWRQLDEQVLSDGGHYERSPMYHAMAAEDYLEDILVLRAIGGTIPRGSVDRLRRMIESLLRLSRLSGSLHLFNDAAHDLAPSTGSILALAEHLLGPVDRPATGAWSMPTSGYFGTRDADGKRDLVIDCGEPGPVYQPGHAHCDLLSYELDLSGRPIVIDSGVHGYDQDAYREFVRSTRAHNTVVINDREQSEVWATFRMARRAMVVSASARTIGDRYEFKGSYHPYHDGRITHERTITLLGDSLDVSDRVAGAKGLPLVSFVHLHPDIVATMDDGRIILAAGAFRALLLPHGVDSVHLHRGELTPVQGWYCPEFGRAIPNTVVAMHLDHNEGTEFGYRITVEAPEHS